MLQKKTKNKLEDASDEVIESGFEESQLQTHRNHRSLQNEEINAVRSIPEVPLNEYYF